ncbi:metallophosphoesterase [Bradyrhizobium sp. HKCCYLS20291]|uniref:metallophosphoesterase n=1 Tax=Bradyrhizobium sp. HKCCYLS20291 TaxID=3420766 RepID=UPI003EBA1551
MAAVSAKRNAPLDQIGALRFAKAPRCENAATFSPQMHLHIFSDLHADVADIKPIDGLPGVDAVVVAGDVCEGTVNGFARLREIVPEPVPIVMVMGNHECYHRTLPDELALARPRRRGSA